MLFGYDNIKVDYSTEKGTFKVILPDSEFATYEEAAGFIDTSDKWTEFSNAIHFEEEEYKTGFGTGVYVKYYFENDIIVLTGCWIEKAVGRLHCDVTVLAGCERIKELHWPKAFKMWEGDNGYTLIPLREGVLIPDNSKQKAYPVFERMFGTREAEMPWWAQACDGKGYMGIVETPFDAGLDFNHEPFKPTVFYVKWRQSMASLTGSRHLHYRFFDNKCNIMTFCNEYRNYAKETGLYVTLEEKMVRNPLLKEIIGTNVINSKMAYWHCEPESEYYYNKEDLSKNDVVIPFDEHGRQFEKLKKRGMTKAYVHFDGWGNMGHDNYHPDVLPPHERCGGTKGFADLQEKCRELGYLFAVHDQYRDFYLNAPSHDNNQSVFMPNGGLLEGCDWPGGKQTMLCQRLAGYYIRRNYEQMKREGILPQGAYLDVFSASLADECSHERHTMTRSECIALRNACFDYIRSLGLIVSSEEAIDCYVPHLDMVNYCPYIYNYIFTRDDDAFGIAIPLVSIVYHTCLFIPWYINFKDTWLPNDESALLHCLISGGITITSTDVSDEMMEQVHLAGRFNEKIWNQEIVDFEYLSDDFKIRRTTFANGVRITADFNKNEADIDWGDGSTEHITAPNL